MDNKLFKLLISIIIFLFLLILLEQKQCGFGLRLKDLKKVWGEGICLNNNK